ncbi:MAG TPA: hypothetical protein PKD55_02400 [Bellilinea sp.]|nr:hypothetical protein [Bellilinea sp.]
MNLEALLDELRSDLQDTGSRPRWNDDLLYLYVKDAVRDYSVWFPRRVDRYALSLSGSAYPLPADFVDDIAVEAPKDTFLVRREPTPGKVYNASKQYFISGGNLYLGEASDEVLLTYFATHPVPTSVDDTAFSFTVPDMDMELIRLYVSAKVHEQMRGKQARLDRFEPGAGRRDDNPLLPEQSSLMQTYYNKIASRVRGGVVKLYTTGRSR